MTTTTALPPTARQAEILAFMRAYYREHGVPPSFREIMSETDIVSPNGISCHLKALGKKGLVRQVKFSGSRCWIPVVPEGCCPCCGRPSE